MNSRYHRAPYVSAACRSEIKQGSNANIQQPSFIPWEGPGEGGTVMFHSYKYNLAAPNVHSFKYKQTNKNFHKLFQNKFIEFFKKKIIFAIFAIAFITSCNQDKIFFIVVCGMTVSDVYGPPSK